MVENIYLLIGFVLGIITALTFKTNIVDILNKYWLKQFQAKTKQQFERLEEFHFNSNFDQTLESDLCISDVLHVIYQSAIKCTKIGKHSKDVVSPGSYKIKIHLNAYFSKIK